MRVLFFLILHGLGSYVFALNSEAVGDDKAVSEDQAVEQAMFKSEVDSGSPSIDVQRLIVGIVRGLQQDDMAAVDAQIERYLVAQGLKPMKSQDIQDQQAMENRINYLQRELDDSVDEKKFDDTTIGLSVGLGGFILLSSVIGALVWWNKGEAYPAYKLQAIQNEIGGPLAEIITELEKNGSGLESSQKTAYVKLSKAMKDFSLYREMVFKAGDPQDNDEFRAMLNNYLSDVKKHLTALSSVSDTIKAQTKLIVSEIDGSWKDLYFGLTAAGESREALERAQDKLAKKIENIYVKIALNLDLEPYESELISDNKQKIKNVWLQEVADDLRNLNLQQTAKASENLFNKAKIFGKQYSQQYGMDFQKIPEPNQAPERRENFDDRMAAKPMSGLQPPSAGQPVASPAVTPPKRTPGQGPSAPVPASGKPSSASGYAPLTQNGMKSGAQRRRGSF